MSVIMREILLVRIRTRRGCSYLLIGQRALPLAGHVVKAPKFFWFLPPYQLHKVMVLVPLMALWLNGSH